MLTLTPRRTRRRSLAAAALIILAASLVGASAARAHSQLEGAVPAPGAILERGPEAVTLTFNEAVSATSGAIRVFDARGDRVDGGTVTVSANGTVVRTPLRPGLAPGTYVVSWRAASADGHPVRGAYTFSIGSPSISDEASRDLASRYLAQSGASVTVGVLSAIGRALGFGGVALLLGTLGASLFWARDQRTRPTFAHLVWLGVGVAAVGSLLALVVQGAYVSGLGANAILRWSLLREVLGTRFGIALVVRLALLGALAGWWVWDRRTERVGLARATGIVLGLAVAVAVAFAGHAASGPLPALGVVLDVLHLIPVSLWFGGLCVLAYVALRNEPVPWSAVDRFSALALLAVIVLVLSGAAQSWRQLGSFDALTTTAYGQILIAKVAVFTLVLPFAAYGRDLLHRRIRDDEPEVGAPDGDDEDEDEDPGIEPVVVQRKLRRSVMIEALFLVVVFALTAVLVNSVPGREVGSGPVVATMADRQLRIEATIAPGQLGPNDVHLNAYTPDGLPANVTMMNAQLTRPDLGAITIPLRRLSPSHFYSPEFIVPQKGTWALVVTTDLDAFTRVQLASEVTFR